MAININGTRVPTYDEMTNRRFTWLAYAGPTKPDSNNQIQLFYSQLQPKPTDTIKPHLSDGVLMIITDGTGENNFKEVLIGHISSLTGSDNFKVTVKNK